MERTIFQKIIDREIPAEIIYEDEHAIVIPDKFPSVHGQLLVIDKKGSSYLFEVDETRYTHLMKITRTIGRALDRAFKTTRTCVIIEGFEIPHTHIRLYPCREEVLLLERYEATEAELAEVALKVRAEIAQE